MRENMIARMLNDPSVSFLVKAQYRESLQRDPVDAHADAKLLTAMLREKMDEVLSQARR